MVETMAVLMAMQMVDLMVEQTAVMMAEQTSAHVVEMRAVGGKEEIGTDM